jgi:hypothetical protein
VASQAESSLLIATNPAEPDSQISDRPRRVESSLHTTAKRDPLRAWGNPIRHLLGTNRVMESDHVRDGGISMLTFPVTNPKSCHEEQEVEADHPLEPPFPSHVPIYLLGAPSLLEEY